jgi:hypothetical protein
MPAIIAIGQAKEKPATPSLTLPLDSLSVDGTEPEVGDEIEHSIKGRVTKITGDSATIRVTALDGEPVEGSPAEEGAESPEEEASEQESESSKSPTGEPAGPPPGPSRGADKALIAAMGRSLRKRAKGRPMPMM